MDFVVFLILGIIFLGLSSFYLWPILASGALFFAWLGFGFLKFTFKLTEILMALMVLGTIFALFSGLSVLVGLAVLSLPLVVSLFLFRSFTKIEGTGKTIGGGLIYLLGLFLALRVVGLGSFSGFGIALLLLLVFVLLDFGISKAIRIK